MSAGVARARVRRCATTVTTKRYYTLAGTTVAVRDSAGAGSLNYLLGDQLGSTTVSVNAAGGTGSVVTQRYLPYGAPRSTVGGAAVTDRGWIGQVKDAITGLQYLNARYYDPTIGRFTAADPIAALAIPDTLDAYGYGGDSPVTMSDPSGLSFVDVVGGGPSNSFVVQNHNTSRLQYNPTPPGGIPPAGPSLLKLAVKAVIVVVGVVAEGACTGATAGTGSVACGAGIGALTAWGFGVVDGERGIGRAELIGGAFGAAGPLASRLTGAIRNARRLDDAATLATEAASPGLSGVNRVGSALKTDAQHAFPDMVDNFATEGSKFSIPTKGPGGVVVRNSELFQVEGSLNGKSGVFEWIVDQGEMTHRRFIPGGKVTGYPNQVPAP